MSSSAKKQLPWVEKYRPKELCDVQGHGVLKDVFSNMIAKEMLPHMVFSGPTGTCKTTIARILCSKLSSDTLDLNASKDRHISTVRTKIKSFCKTKTSGLKVVMLDEADAMVKVAQQALKSIMETESKNTRFIFICNDVVNIDSAIRSRCMEFKFCPLSCDDLMSLKQRILPDLDDQYAMELAVESNGDARSFINKLQFSPPSLEKGVDIACILPKCCSKYDVISKLCALTCSVTELLTAVSFFYVHHPTPDDVYNMNVIQKCCMGYATIRKDAQLAEIVKMDLIMTIAAQM